MNRSTEPQPRSWIALRRGKLARGLAVATCTATASFALCAATALADPIASSGPAPSLPAFQGKAAKAHTIKGSSKPPQNPFLARDPFSNIHDDTWMTDSYRYRGPLGRSLSATSAAKPPRICGSIAFDNAGRLVSVCPSPVTAPQARVMDPNTLETISTYDLPDAPSPAGTKAYQNFSGGGYFFLDNRGRMWVPTKTDHIFVLTVGSDGSLTKTGDYDLTGVLDAANERITSVLPDFKGRMWFVTKQNGKVGTLNPNTGTVRIRILGEEIENSFAMGKKGVFIASDRRMYRFDPTKNGTPKITWKAGYKNSGIVKPSQVDAGTGTTPTIMKGGYVAITDNAQPMHVVVYRTGTKSELRGRPTRRLPGPGVRQVHRRHGELAARRRPLADRREQLRLSGPVRPERRCPHDAGIRQGRRRQGRQGVPQGVGQP